MPAGSRPAAGALPALASAFEARRAALLTWAGALAALAALAGGLVALAAAQVQAASVRPSPSPARAQAASVRPNPSPARAQAASSPPRVTLHASFRPDRLGASTTIHYGFTISPPTPLRQLTIRLPPRLGFAHSSIGIEPCPPKRLAEYGPQGCPSGSLLGFGSAVAQVRALSTVTERAPVTAVLGPPQGQNMTILFFLDGQWPVREEIVLTAHLLQIASRAGARLLTEAPLLPVWPGGPPVALMSFSSTLGPEGITYHRVLHGRRVGFTPRGVSLPDRCAGRGFPIEAAFSWWGQADPVSARTYVPCPTGPSVQQRR